VVWPPGKGSSSWKDGVDEAMYGCARLLLEFCVDGGANVVGAAQLGVSLGPVTVDGAVLELSSLKCSEPNREPMGEEARGGRVPRRGGRFGPTSWFD